MSKVKKFVSGEKYVFLEDYTDPNPLLGGFIPKGTNVIFQCPNLGFARFYLRIGQEGIKGFKHGSISLKPKTAFKIIGEVHKEGEE